MIVLAGSLLPATILVPQPGAFRPLHGEPCSHASRFRLRSAFATARKESYHDRTTV